MNKAFKLALNKTMPVLAGYLFLGIGFGVLMHKAGFSYLLTQSLSLFVFAGALQYAAVSILSNAFVPLSVLVLSLMINLRHVFYGFSLMGRYTQKGIKKLFLIFGLTDETFSINAATELPQDIDASQFYFYVSLLNYIYWNVATGLGFTLAQWVPDSIKGLEFILTALFYVLFLNQWDKKEARESLNLGLSVSLVALLIVGQQNFLLLAMGLIVIFLNLRHQTRRPS